MKNRLLFLLAFVLSSLILNAQDTIANGNLVVDTIPIINEVPDSVLGYEKIHSTIEIYTDSTEIQLDTLDVFDSDIYDYYNLPTEKDGKLTLEISQGSDGDYNGNDSKYFVSDDNGNTWNVVN